MENQLLNEVYFGKTNSIVKMKETFDKLYEYIKNNKTPPYREDFYMELCKMVEKQWGFKSFRLIIHGRDIDNAYTLPVSTSLKNYKSITDLFILKKDNISLNPKYKLSTYVCIYRGEFINGTSDQAFATLLHEVGHSFQGVVNQTLSRTTSGIKKSVSDITLRQIYKSEIVDTIDAVDKVIEDDEEFKSATTRYENEVNYAPKEMGMFGKFIMNANAIAGLPFSLARGLGRAIALPFVLGKYVDSSKTVSTFNGIGNEYFSDSFAAMYGYGSSIASGLINSRMKNDKSYAKNILANVYSLIYLPDSFILTTHPDTFSRAMSVLSHYEYELTNNKDLLSPSDIKEIEGQIEELRNMLKTNLEDAKKIEGIKIGRKLYRIIFNKFYYKVFKKNFDDSDYDFGMEV